MKTVIKMYILLAAALSPVVSFAQYFQRLYDYDTTTDLGINIFIAHDNNYLITGNLTEPTNNLRALYNVKISAITNGVLSKHIFKNDSVSYYDGNPGEAKTLSNGEYIEPLSVEFARTSYRRVWAGLVKYNASGDTIFMKTYTDTSQYFDGMYSCAIANDGGYLIGGMRQFNDGTNYRGLLIRTDSLGDTLWTHTYQHRTDERTQIVNIIPLNDNRVVLAASNAYQRWDGTNPYSQYFPWFIIIDGAGNILKDSVFDGSYAVGANICGSLYTDRNGGYFHIGCYDSLFDGDPDHAINFPAYVARLDTNFRITWITEMPFSDHYAHRQAYNVHQLNDGNIIIDGEADGFSFCLGTCGWAAKIDEQTGRILWSHNYLSDSSNLAYVTDATEKPDGSLVFVGYTFNDTLPSWHGGDDVWLMGTDSNGCLLPGCDPDTSGGVVDTITRVITPTPKGEFAVFPNPNSGIFTIRFSSWQTGVVQLMVTNMLGEKVKELAVPANKETEVQLNGPPGVYFINCVRDGMRECVRVVVER